MNFEKKCYQLISKIPHGKVCTYKEIARALGSKAYRAVGNAMAKNKNLVLLPCHRVIKSDGSVGKYISGINKKILLLRKEGVMIEKKKIVDLKKYFFSFDS